MFCITKFFLFHSHSLPKKTFTESQIGENCLLYYVLWWFTSNLNWYICLKMNLDYVMEYSKKGRNNIVFEKWSFRRGGEHFSIFFSSFFFFKQEMMVKISTFYYVEYNKEMRVFCKIECCRRKVMLVKWRLSWCVTGERFSSFFFFSIKNMKNLFCQSIIYNSCIILYIGFESFIQPRRRRRRSNIINQAFRQHTTTTLWSVIEI